MKNYKDRFMIHNVLLGGFKDCALRRKRTTLRIIASLAVSVAEIDGYYVESV
jgi:hypothetical protein